ncbi:EamA family transporter RarD [Thermodesulfobacteriota bacterium]
MNKFRKESVLGVGYAGPAFLIWGLSPLYWKVLRAVPAFEIIMHRVIWSFLFLLAFILIRRSWKEFTASLKNWRILLILLVTTLLVVGNWLLYIWAVNHDHVLQASLGYYINPLVNVLLGVLFLKERLRPLQVLAVVIAASSVCLLTLHYGEFPWIALTLGFSFGFYGLIRKVAPVSPLVGLSIETLILFLPALGYITYLDIIGTGSFLRVSITIDLFLVGSALVTALPLLLFNLAARRLHLSTVGFMQYIAPSCMFLLAVFLFREPFTMAQVWTFILIWLALAFYSVDSVLYYRRFNGNLKE